MVRVDTRDLKRLEEHLTRYAKKALPFAVRSGLNETAFTARKAWVGELKQQFVLRNRYTERSIRVDKATSLRIDTMQSRVGSPLDYLARQEEGFTEQKKGKHGIAVPTSVAAGQGLKTRPRTRSVRRANYLSALSVTSRVRGSQRQKNAAAIAIAAKTGKTAFLDLGKRKGLFRVDGKKNGVRIKMLYDLSRPTLTTKPHPTLGPALKAIMPKLPAIQEKALLDELRRHRVLWYGM